MYKMCKTEQSAARQRVLEKHWERCFLQLKQWGMGKAIVFFT